MAARGMPQSDARRDVLGTFQVDTRIYLGDEFPVVLQESARLI